jgi:hypothetical protein
MAITKSIVEQHGPPTTMPTNAKVGSGAAEEYAPSPDRPHPPPLVEIRYTGLPVVKASMEMTV